MIDGIGRSRPGRTGRRFLPVVLSPRQNHERTDSHPDYQAPEPAPLRDDERWSAMPGHDCRFITQLAAMASPADGERRSRRNPLSTISRANLAYAHAQRRGTDLEAGFFSDASL